ncbi:MAG: LuxR C-terminal-related transcriptional regulator [Candidatus Gastranaerophilaceae bacterium]
MSKHRATMTDRRHQILVLIAKGYKNKQIARKMGLSLCNLKLQKWRLYCYLGEIHTEIDAVFMGLQMGLLRESDLAASIREEIYDSQNEKQMYGYT